MTEAKDYELVKEIRDRFDVASKAVDELYDLYLDDLKFLNGEQWQEALRKERESEGRPCLVINKLPTFADQVIGDIRQNSPSIKVKPVDSNGDPETAEILTGLIRNIQCQSDAEVAYDTAVEGAVHCGMGAFRILTQYTDDDVFDQDILIERIVNPFSVYWDPSAIKWDRSDAKYCIVTEMMDLETFKDQYPDASTQEFPGSRDTAAQWPNDKSIRVAEYFKVDTKTLKLYQVKDSMTGNELVVDEVPEGWEVVRERDIEKRTVKWWKTNGYEILEGPTELPGKWIPIVMVYGKELHIEGKTIYRGVVRHAKDAQRLYNYSRSMGAETISLAPKSPYLVTARMIGNYQQIWDNSSKRSFPYLPYDVDPDSPSVVPRRSDPISTNTGIQAEVIVADQEMHDTTGLQQASLGKQSNEKSGRAIVARQREGDVANFAYYDNLARALRYAGKILIDLIPKIYDTSRVIRIMGEDGSTESVPVNQPVQRRDGKQGMYDLTVGKYDVTVTIGPSYTTQREEAADSMMAFLGAVPAAGPFIADLIAKNMDWPGADQIEKRLKAMLPPGIAGEEGGPPPAAPPPDPKMEMDARKTAAEIEGILLDNLKKKRELEMPLESETPQ